MALAMDFQKDSTAELEKSKKTSSGNISLYRETIIIY